MVIDLLIRDTAMDDLPTQDICQGLQESATWRSTPTVFLAPSAGRWRPGSLPLRDAKEGLICKPFAAAEVQREVDLVLAGLATSDVITVAEGVEMERSAQAVRSEQSMVGLTPKEFRLLVCPAEHQGRFVSTQEL
jgi:DNA-binding response OmpR family regulator